MQLLYEKDLQMEPKLNLEERKLKKSIETLNPQVRSELCEAFLLASILGEKAKKLSDYKGLDVSIKLYSGVEYHTKFKNLIANYLITSGGEIEMSDIQSIVPLNSELIKRSYDVGSNVHSSY